MSLTGQLGGSRGAGDKGLQRPLLETLRLAWADEELRSRLTFILFVLAAYVVGVHVPVPVPGIDPAKLADILEQNQFFSMMNALGGGAFKRVSIFALGLGPYIVASIILQVLTMGNPKWKEEMKEGGEYARRQQNKRTRFLTLGLCLFQGFGLLQLLQQTGAVQLDMLAKSLIVFFWMCGSMILLWLGEQVSEKGIGNGVSILIFAGIVIALPALIENVGSQALNNNIAWWRVVLLAVLFFATTWFIVLFTVAQRRIPVQHMRRNFGTKSLGGQVSYLPIAVAMAGVIPIIFAITLIYLPSQFAAAFPAGSVPYNVLNEVQRFTNPDFTTWRGLVGAALYTGMIFFFTYFWTALQYNVDDIADHLKKGGSYIQGIRPGKQTRDFLNGVVSRVTFIGAVFLSLAALTQFVVPLVVPMPGLGLIAGTSLLIMVSVALETVRQVEANLITKQYEG
ncbi:preprotein translocase subunit SecY [Kamptonema cortianum]|nr:preprotein translocase subunit SecY [Geitlerinema splendidum]MDK3162233.1 preprotein translocase subunit SecY [Kamptonema cortianum]